MVYPIAMIKSCPQSAAILFALLLTTPVLSAQDQQVNPSIKEQAQAETKIGPSADPYDQPVLEEVVVTGQHSVATIRREMFKTQDLVYNTFNELNKDDDYDMVCVKEARIGSQIKYKKCRPRFMIEEMSEANTDWRDDGTALISWTEMRKKSLRQREIMANLANNNPHFLDLLKRRLALKKAYESKREQCGWELSCQNRDRKK